MSLDPKMARIIEQERKKREQSDKEQGSVSNPDNLTLEEAKQLAREGHKVRHRYFSANEYMEYRDGWNGEAFYFEDGVNVTKEWFPSHWLQDGWSIYKEQ